ncbi:hypothetical protein [Micropruina sonneratiae]|uniref:hypothetical protein n=1 Tax=Micropruina sonneratiae TaxID=2986940 RepID=UPI0022279989|nr:hypothetical protein [Micropruina sp. KQZ13P-5]MCW3159457.1 hypothetical protein [Micropruina sp. KQZ13P-5]
MTKRTERQAVRANNIERSFIEQIIGDKIVVALDGISSPIYLTYGDSDIQALYLASEPRAATSYAKALDEAVRLLVCFKAPQAQIILSPSSLIQSRLTREVMTPFLRVDSPDENANFLILRREPTWREYFEKRQGNTSSLRSIDSFSDYFNESVIAEISSLSSSRKKFFSGSQTIYKWADLMGQVSRIRGLSHPQILEAAFSSLQSDAFVFETSMDVLKGLGVEIGPNDARGVLVDAYLATVATGCAVPTAIRLRWDPCPATATQRAISIGQLYSEAKTSGIQTKVFRTTIPQLLTFAASPEMWSIRNRVALSMGS